MFVYKWIRNWRIHNFGYGAWYFSQVVLVISKYKWHEIDVRIFLM